MCVWAEPSTAAIAIATAIAAVDHSNGRTRIERQSKPELVAIPDSGYWSTNTLCLKHFTPPDNSWAKGGEGRPKRV